MDEKEQMHSPVEYAVHEGILARMERTIKRLWVLNIILIILLAARILRGPLTKDSLSNMLHLRRPLV